jgi:hypothetical protein
MRRHGRFADLIEKRFELACKRLGLNQGRDESFDLSRFRPPRANDRRASCSDRALVRDFATVGRIHESHERLAACYTAPCTTCCA